MENNKKELDWYLIDAKGEIVGRLATKVADLLRGKKKPSFLPNTDNGDYVVVINADKFVFTGKKEEQKRYYRHTGYLGNLKTFTVEDLKESHPDEVIKHAVEGMLPHNKLSKGFMGRLKIYAGENHPHQNIKFKNQG